MSKYKDRGFWISNHFYWQSLLHYFWYSARFRSFTFFSASNPGIDLGGMLDENKSDIYKLLPHHFIPATIKVNGQRKINRNELELAGLAFPLIVKPNIGFKGYKVAKVYNLKELQEFLDAQDKEREWLAQEFLNYEREFSLLFYRIPGVGKCGISSLVEKIYPYVIGDGHSSIDKLIDQYENPFMDRISVYRRFQDRFTQVLQKGEKLVLDEIGNYARGSKFFDLGQEIDNELQEVTKDYFSKVPGLDFFRMDFKADSLAAYKQGEFKILEINGAKSEPIHIYDPNSSFIENARTIRLHWKIISKIVKARRKYENYKFPTTQYGLKSLFAIKKLVH